MDDQQLLGILFGSSELNFTQARDALFGPSDQTKKLARRTEELKSSPGKSIAQQYGEKALPFLGAVRGYVDQRRVGEAVQRYKDGEANDEDIDLIARSERQHEVEKGQSVVRQLAGELGGIQGMIGEFTMGGAGVRGLGMARGAGPMAAAKAGALATPAVPSSYLPRVAQNQIEHPDESTFQQVAPAVGLAMAQNAILGQAQRLFSGANITRAGRIGLKGAVGVAEQAGVDVAATALDRAAKRTFDTSLGIDTKYGTLGALLSGEEGAVKHAALQYLTFSLFAAMHSGREVKPETFKKAVDHLAEQGLTPEQAGEALAKATPDSPGPVGELAKTYSEVAAAGSARMRRAKAHGDTLPPEQTAPVVRNPLEGVEPAVVKSIAAELGVTQVGLRKRLALGDEGMLAGVERELVRRGLKSPVEAPKPPSPPGIQAPAGPEIVAPAASEAVPAAKPSLMDRIRAGGSRPAVAKTAAPVSEGPQGKIVLPEPPGFQRPEEVRLSPVERELVAREEPRPVSLAPEPKADAVVLEPREVQVLAERAKGRSLQSIGEELGISRQRVKQIEQAALAKQGQLESMAEGGKAGHVAKMLLEGKETEIGDVALSETEYREAIAWLDRAERSKEQMRARLEQIKKRQALEKNPDVQDIIQTDIFLLERLLGDEGRPADPEARVADQGSPEVAPEVQAARPAPGRSPDARERELFAEWRGLMEMSDSPEKRQKSKSIIRALEGRGMYQTPEKVGQKVTFDPAQHELHEMSGSYPYGEVVQRGWVDAGGHVKIKPVVRKMAAQDELSPIRYAKEQQIEHDRIRAEKLAEMTEDEREAFLEREAIETADFESLKMPGEDPMDLGGAMFGGPGGPLFEKIKQFVVHHLFGRKPGRPADFKPAPSHPDRPMPVPDADVATRMAFNQLGARSTKRHQIPITARALTVAIGKDIANAWRLSRTKPEPFLNDPAFHDRIEAEQRNPGSQKFTPEEKAAYDLWTDEIWMPALKRMEAEGVKAFRDENTGQELTIPELRAKGYMHRVAVPEADLIRSIREFRAAKPGAKGNFQKQRTYKTAAEGVAEGVKYEPYYDTVADFIYQVNRVIADARLARDPKLGGKDLVQARIARDMARHKDALDALKGTPEHDQLQQLIVMDAHRDVQGNVTVAPAFKRFEYADDVASDLKAHYGERGGETLKVAQAMTNALREVQLGADASFAFLQLLPLTSNPLQWGKAAKALAGAAKAAVWEGAFQRYLQAKPENMQALNESVQAGMSYNTRIENSTVGTGRSWLDKIPVVKHAYGRAQRAMTTALDIAKIELWKANRSADPKNWPKEAEAIEDSLGLGRMEKLGMTPERALMERLIFLAPSYYRGYKRLLEHAYHGGPAGRIARKQLASLASGVFFTTLAGLYAAKEMGWLTEDEMKERLTPGKDRFLMVPVPVGGGKNIEVGFGSFYVNMIQTLARAKKYVGDPDPDIGEWRNVPIGEEIATKGKNKGKTVQVWSKEPAVKDPVTQWYKGHAGSLVQAFLQGIQGEDFQGDPTTKGDAALRLVTPLSVQKLIYGEGNRNQDVAEAGVGSFGLRSFPGQTQKKK